MSWHVEEGEKTSDQSFERVALSPAKLAPPVREIHLNAAAVFKDSFLLEFLDLPKDHSEADLHAGLVAKLKDFLIELGRDFCFVGSHYPIQVGGRDYENMNVTVELSDSELNDICRLTGERKKGPAIRKLVVSALMTKRREEIAGRFISGKWGVELAGFEVARDADRKAGRKRATRWRERRRVR